MYPSTYIDFLILFHSYRDYFECHEVLEDQWKKDPKGERKIYWVGLIQFAVTLYHYRRGNWLGAEKMIKKPLINLKHCQREIEELGIDYYKLMNILLTTQERIHARKDYEDQNIPLNDPSLEDLCKRISLNLGLKWCTNSDMNNNYLINKHKLRKL